FADPSNHSSLPSEDEVEAVLARHGLTRADPYALFPTDTAEGRYLAARGEKFREGIARSRRQRREKREAARRAVEAAGGLPETLDIDLSLFPMAHTQWMWGQIAAKLVRVSTAGAGERGGAPGGARAKPLTEDEKRWASVASFVLTLSPDVGT